MKIYITVRMEASEKGSKCHEDELRIPYVWYQDGNEIIVGICGYEEKLILDLKVEESIEVNTEEIVRMAVLNLLRDKLKGSPNVKEI